MIKQELGIQELENSPISIEEYKKIPDKRQISFFLEKIKSMPAEQIKFYLGFLYFAALLFFSITLFL